MGDTIREVLGNYKKYYVIDGKETSPEKLCERLGFTTQQLWSRIGDLSGGQRRRLSLLLTILDEPMCLSWTSPATTWIPTCWRLSRTCSTAGPAR